MSKIPPSGQEDQSDDSLNDSYIPIRRILYEFVSSRPEPDAAYYAWKVEDMEKTKTETDLEVKAIERSIEDVKLVGTETALKVLQDKLLEAHKKQENVKNEINKIRKECVESSEKSKGYIKILEKDLLRMKDEKAFLDKRYTKKGKFNEKESALLNQNNKDTQRIEKNEHKEKNKLTLIKLSLKKLQSLNEESAQFTNNEKMLIDLSVKKMQYYISGAKGKTSAELAKEIDKINAEFEKVLLLEREEKNIDTNSPKAKAPDAPNEFKPSDDISHNKEKDMANILADLDKSQEDLKHEEVDCQKGNPLSDQKHNIPQQDAMIHAQEATILPQQTQKSPAQESHQKQEDKYVPSIHTKETSQTALPLRTNDCAQPTALTQLPQKTVSGNQQKTYLQANKDVNEQPQSTKDQKNKCISETDHAYEKEKINTEYLLGDNKERFIPAQNKQDSKDPNTSMTISQDIPCEFEEDVPQNPLGFTNNNSAILCLSSCSIQPLSPQPNKHLLNVNGNILGTKVLENNTATQNQIQNGKLISLNPVNFDPQAQDDNADKQCGFAQSINQSLLDIIGEIEQNNT